MKKILITGFEPFDDNTSNPSWEAVKALPSKIGKYTLYKLCLPVVFSQAAQEIIKEAEKLCPDVIISVGLAKNRCEITPELVGINLRYARIADNKGNMPQDEPIISGGENAYFSTLPVRKIAQAINTVTSAQVSYSAGSYVCNDVFYTLLDYFKGTKTRVGFIHVPLNIKNDDGTVGIQKITEGLKIAVENLD